MSIVIHGNNFVNLQQGQFVQNVNGSAGDTITIKFNGYYFVPNQYYPYVRQLIRDACIINLEINHNIIPNSWLKVWKHFTNNTERNVVCCTCGIRNATVGGHVILNNPGQISRINRGSNSVFIIPICGVCNGQNRNLTIFRNIRGVKLFDYYSSYGEEFILESEEHGIRITHIYIEPPILQHIQNVEANGNANYGHIERNGREGQMGQQGRQEQQPQAGQARRYLYYNNPNARR